MDNGGGTIHIQTCLYPRQSASCEDTGGSKPRGYWARRAALQELDTVRQEGSWEGHVKDYNKAVVQRVRDSIKWHKGTLEEERVEEEKEKENKNESRWADKFGERYDSLSKDYRDQWLAASKWISIL